MKQVSSAGADGINLQRASECPGRKGSNVVHVLQLVGA